MFSYALDPSFLRLEVSFYKKASPFFVLLKVYRDVTDCEFISYFSVQAQPHATTVALFIGNASSTSPWISVGV